MGGGATESNQRRSKAMADNLQWQTVNAEITSQRERLSAVMRGQDDLRNSLATFVAKTDERFGSLGKDLDTKFTALGTTISAQSKTPWGNIIAACGVTFGILSGLIALITGPIISSVGETKMSMREQRLETVQLIKDTSAAIVRDQDAFRMRINDEIKTMREHQVPRKEHEKDWAAQARADADMQRQINDLREQHNSLYSARDVIRRLEGDVDRIREELRRKNG